MTCLQSSTSQKAKLPSRFCSPRAILCDSHGRLSGRSGDRRHFCQLILFHDEAPTAHGKLVPPSSRQCSPTSLAGRFESASALLMVRASASKSSTAGLSCKLPLSKWPRGPRDDGNKGVHRDVGNGVYAQPLAAPSGASWTVENRELASSGARGSARFGDPLRCAKMAHGACCQDAARRLVSIKRLFLLTKTVWTAAKQGLRHLDVETASLDGECDTEIYMIAPEGTENAGQVVRLQKSLYGLKQAPRIWYEKLSQTLTAIYVRLGLLHYATRPNILSSKRHLLLTFGVGEKNLPRQALYLPPPEGDEVGKTWARLGGNGKKVFYSYVGEDNVVEDFKALERMDNEAYGELRAALRTLFDLPAAETNWLDRARIPLEQQKRLLTLCKALFRITVITDHQPLVSTLSSSKDLVDTNRIHRFRVALQGFAADPAVISRPDLSFAASTLARHTATPTAEHYAASTRAVSYLKHTQGYELRYEPSPKGLMGYSDAKWASDPHVRRKSTSGYCIYLYGCLVSWSTRLQKCRHRGSTRGPRHFARWHFALDDSRSPQSLTVLGALGQETAWSRPRF